MSINNHIHNPIQQLAVVLSNKASNKAGNKMSTRKDENTVNKAIKEPLSADPFKTIGDIPDAIFTAPVNNPIITASITASEKALNQQDKLDSETTGHTSPTTVPTSSTKHHSKK